MRALWQGVGRSLALLVAIAGIGATYAPVLRMGLVAEDYQFCLKGAKVAAEPAELLRPFQLVWRPGVYALDALLAGAGSPALGYRAAQFLAGLGLAVLGWLFLRRVFVLGPWGSTALTLLWLASPLASEPLCGQAALAGHTLFGCCVLTALLVRPRAAARRRATGVAVSVAFAASFQEGWIVMPALFFLQDVWLFEMAPRAAARRAVPWVVGVAAYLAAYGAVCGFAYRGFYSAGVREALAKSVATLAVFFHLATPSPWRFAEIVQERPLAMAGGLGLLGLLIAFAAVWRLRAAWFGLAATVALMLPTALSSGQASRWTLLPWFFFLTAVGVVVREMLAVRRRRVVGGVVVACLFVSLLAHDVVLARGDVEDWARLEALTARLDVEVEPLLVAGRRGESLVVLRGDDGEPWRDLVMSPRGQTKFYFPRRDDPYGVVSLSALLSWRSLPEGWAMERVPAIPAGTNAIAFIHEVGGFRRMSAGPDVAIGRPVGSNHGWPGVLLVRRPWAEVSPAEFP